MCSYYNDKRCVVLSFNISNECLLSFVCFLDPLTKIVKI